jgi:hypothetical protein
MKGLKEEVMDKGLGRRKFLKDGFFFGVASAVGARGLGDTEPFKRPLAAKHASSLAVIPGSEYGKNALKAVDVLGGMKKFVAKGARVALLPNSHDARFDREKRRKLPERPRSEGNRPEGSVHYERAVLP